MKASHITHNNESRIKIDFGYNKEITGLIKQIPGSKWSNTIKAWHIPYTKEAYKMLTGLFPDIEIITDTISRSAALRGAPTKLTGITNPRDTNIYFTSNYDKRITNPFERDQFIFKAFTI